MTSNHESKTSKFPDEIPGVGAAKTKRLIESGYGNHVKLALAKVTELSELEGIGEGTALKAIGWAQEITGIGVPKSALELMQKAKENRTLSTGVKELDTLLGGGLRAGYVYEIAGKNGHGKSQFSCAMVAACVSPVEVGGWGGKAAWLDTEGVGDLLTFRMADMISGFGAPPEEFLGNAAVLECMNTEMQINTVRRFLEKGIKYDLIVIDGVMTRFRTEYLGRGTLGERQNLLGDHLADLKNYAKQHNAVILLTNQVTDKPDVMYGNPTEPVGGNILGHAVAYRLYIRKAKDSKRVIRMDKSPNLPNGEALFTLTSEGITD